MLTRPQSGMEALQAQLAQLMVENADLPNIMDALSAQAVAWVSSPQGRFPVNRPQEVWWGPSHTF